MFGDSDNQRNGDKVRACSCRQQGIMQSLIVKK
jgi:hypothetical protein